MIDHEKLDVYKVSVEFTALALRIVKALPRGHASLADQLRRAATSVPLNIAEACGKPSMVERARFFTTARGSAMECAAILDICHILSADVTDEVRAGKRLLHRAIAMLTKLSR
jgi:four helix bundle protein